MNQLKVIPFNGQLVTDSREVAEMLGKRHTDLLRSIHGYVDVLENAKLRSQEFFISSTYKVEGNNKTYEHYLLTRKGCDMVANKMTGEKGVLFTAAYVTRFEEMEQHIKQEAQPQSSLELALQAALKHEQDIKGIRSDVEYLKGSMRIDSLQEQEIQQEANKSVVQALGGKESNAYKQIRNKAFSAFWKEFKGYFNVPRYGDIPKIKHDEALRFIQIWRPSASLQMEIDACNSQMSF